MNHSLSTLLEAFDPTLPLARARTIPSSWYHSSEIYELERAAVFGTTWQAAGRTDLVAHPGAYFTAEIAGEPLLVLREGEGDLRAFSNVCRHRAAPVMSGQGTATRLRCPDHAWTYDLSGRLRGTPEFDGVADFCKDEQGLPPLAVGTWGPTVWVCGDGGSLSLSEQLDPLPARTVGRLEGLRFVERRSYDLACNWKVYVDNYLDGGYHINSIHPGLAGVLDYSQYRTDLFTWSNLQQSPLKTGDADVAAVRTGTEAQYWWVFPNFMVNLYDGVMDTNLVLPLGPDRCRVVFDFYFADQTPEFIHNSLAVGEQVQQEDIAICEQVQRGLHSRGYDVGRFSVKREAAGYHFHQLLARCFHQTSTSQATPANS